MKAVIQRVRSASVSVAGVVAGEIGQGILVLLGVEKGDQEAQADWLAEKIATLRIFEDQAGKMNLALRDIGGAVLAVSQFTLAGSCTKGRRPSFDRAASAEEGKRLYDYFLDALKRQGVPTAAGIFQADMQVTLINDGPVTFVLER